MRTNHYVLCLVLMLTAFKMSAHEYKVKVLDKEKLRVEARFILESNVISMWVNPIPQLPDGQASFVEGLSVTDVHGKAIKVKDLGVGDWKLAAKAGDEVIVTYDVRADHGDYNWPFGEEEVAYATADGMFFTGSSLFIAPSSNSTEPIQVSFELPSSEWTVSAPWKQVGAMAPTFEVADVYHLFKNGLFIGTHQEASIPMGDLNLKLVISDDFGSAKDSLVQWLGEGLESVSKMFGATPGDDYLIVINPGKRTDGGAFLNSFSMVLNGQLNEAAANVWVHGLIHEAFHLWNGIGMDGGSDVEWFTEGATDYMTVLHLSRSGLITPEVALKKLENSIRKELLARMLQGIDTPLAEAGEEKAKNRLLIYGGGAVKSFMLDMELREATSNKYGLDELMRALYSKYGTSGKPLTNEGILAEANAISGKDLSEFFNAHIFGVQPVDLNTYYNQAGLDYYSFIEEIYLIRTSEQHAVRQAILGF